MKKRLLVLKNERGFVEETTPLKILKIKTIKAPRGSQNQEKREGMGEKEKKKGLSRLENSWKYLWLSATRNQDECPER